jgi:mRNA interferase MazF
MRRGDVFMARLDPVEGSEQGGARPVVIVSRDIINSNAAFVIAVPLTSRQRRRVLPSHVAIAAGEAGLNRDSWALAEQVRVLSKSRFGQRWGTVTTHTMLRIDAALASALALDNSDPSR